ncbi:helix-turn-helix domain containing protein [Anoxybacillus geothermalis]|uniref:TetR/AcrR family transcriptional regulator n=1 Tax=Geobacillus sp. DSP4a TaxID=2508873 RepID=UPI0005068D6C|nr:TetR/AcrR family transcriptional regulator [Geobacillus sp. DSP4a]KFL17364.1 TetR family transcriptional regulator [Geobacillus stearothermophilus]MED4924853.1 helix-turn-helix domain containing protein [Anoxybacillus geothermalis]STO13784.1 HTH-type transcriptional repressor KstR2 [[Flavobacterium] thermophilum]KFX33551.1 TetR family transcriptional regulator [Geobacillus stearothermophilus]KZE96468.1 HTH-type transcriptional repressor KstR2 [Geobacillus stearothermophilus]
MDERRVRFIETAMKLFAEKGYHATSIQDLVEAWGISKGAFYHHFASKEELLLEVLRYYSEKMVADFTASGGDGPEKERFIRQLAAHFSHIREYKDFLRMIMSEQLPKVNPEVERYMFRQHGRLFLWYCTRLTEVYGEAVGPYVYDVAMMINGIIRQYLFYFFFREEAFDADEAARFLMRRLDAIVASFTAEERPLLTEESFAPWVKMEEQERERQRERLASAFAAVREAVNDLDPKQASDVLEAIAALEEELLGRHAPPRAYIVEALLLYLRHQQTPQLAPALDALVKEMDEYQRQNGWEREVWKKR